MNKNKGLIFFKQVGYVFLIPVFFLLHGYNENFGLIPTDTFFHLFFKYLLIVLVVFGLCYTLFKSLIKTALFCCFLLCIFFFFGAFHDFLRSHTSGFLVSYTFLLPFIGLACIVVFFLVRYINRVPQKLTRFLISLFSLFMLWETILVLNNFLNSNNGLNDLGSGVEDLSAAPVKSIKQKPDVFFVVFDGYTSSKCLQEEFNYRNSEIDSSLKKYGFFTSYRSKSNYNMTPFSLSSTFNGNYLRKEVGKTLVSNKVFCQAIDTYKINSVTTFFKNNGYEIKNFGLFNHQYASTTSVPYFNGWEERLIDNQTLSSRIVRDIGWNFILKDWFTGSFKVPKLYLEKKAFHINRNNENLKKLILELQTSGQRPRLVITHAMLPHEPFYFDSTGGMVSDTAILRNSLVTKTAYLSQLIYSNKFLKQLIYYSASSEGMRPRVVIIEGDHGFRDYKPDIPEEKVFMNLNTYFFSDRDYSMLYDGISPVNSFRVVLNKYFNQHLPLLKDSSIYLRQPAPW